jgi:hypothetical protein
LHLYLKLENLKTIQNQTNNNAKELTYATFNAYHYSKFNLSKQYLIVNLAIILKKKSSVAVICIKRAKRKALVVEEGRVSLI